MSAGWVAVGVRAKGLSRRRIGREQAGAVAMSPSLVEAVSALARTPYGVAMRDATNLAECQRAVDATLLWHLRILAGWCPPLGSAMVRTLAAGFEVRNVVDHLLRLRGRPVPTPFVLGSLATAWTSVAPARTPSEVRQALSRSAWGDPLSEDPAGVLLAMNFAWAAHVYDQVPEAARWARGAAGFLVARARQAGAESVLPTSARRQAAHVLGPRWDPVERSDIGAGKRELDWWQDVEADSSALAARPPQGAAVVVGVTGLLAADARLTRAALAIAAAGGGEVGAIVDAVG
jgi:hypothetical protein